MQQRMASARAAIAEGDFGAADAHCVAVLAEDPTHRGALLCRVDAALAADDPQTARQRIAEARRALTTDPAAAARLAGAYLSCNQPMQALAMLDGVAPEGAAFLAIRGAVLRELGRMREADRDFSDALALDPAHRGATLGRIDLVLARGASSEALACCDRAAAVLGDDPGLAVRKATAHRLSANTLAGIAVLKAALAKYPSFPPLLIGLSAACREAGRLAEAEAHLATLRAIRPRHRGMLLSRMDLALDRGHAEEALRQAIEAETILPGDPGVALRRAAALRALHRLEKARVCLLDALAVSPGQPALRTALASALRQLGLFQDADAEDSAVLRTDPCNRGALLGRVDSAWAMGDPVLAQTRMEEASRRRPEDPSVALRAARMLRESARPARARRALAALQRQAPADPSIALIHAATCRDLDDDPAADRILSDLRESRPDHPALLMDRVAGLIARDDSAEALRLAIRSTRESPLPVVLQAATTALHAALADGRSDGLHEAVELLAQHRTVLDGGSLWRLWQASGALAMPDASDRLARTLASRECLPADVAIDLLRYAVALVPRAELSRLVTDLAGRVPRSHRADMESEGALLLHGPDAALRRLRSIADGPRPPHSARQCARLLLLAGDLALAGRYLRLCRRRWPGDGAFLSLAVSVHLADGRPGAALRLLDAVPARSRGRRKLVQRERARALVELERLPRALKLQNDAARGDPEGDSPAFRLRLCIATGKLEAAQALAARIRRRPRPEEAGRRHPGISHLGLLLTEVRLWQTARPDTGPGPDHLARYTFAAIEALGGGGGRAGAGFAPVPQRIVQYWDKTVPPPDVAAVMQSWQGHDGWSYRLFDRAAAQEFLEREFGARHVRAFRLANNVAEGADFLRLCLLLAEGGLYADADDRLVAAPEALCRPGRGLVIFREPFGALANNVLAACPGHPAISLAVDMAAEALIGRDNDSTWSKTGPGLLTRAVAAHLARNEGAPDVTILPLRRLRRAVRIHMALPHKTAGGYWDAADRKRRGSLLAMLAQTPDRPVSVAGQA